MVAVSMLMIFRSRSESPLAASTLLMASWWLVPRNIAILRPLRSFTPLMSEPLGDGQIGCLVRAAGEQELGLEAVGAADHRGQVALEREVELAVGDGLVHGGPGTLEERPLDPHAGIVRELLLEIALGMRGGGRAAADEGPVADADRGVADADHERVGGMNGRRQGELLRGRAPPGPQRRGGC